MSSYKCLALNIYNQQVFFLPREIRLLIYMHAMCKSWKGSSVKITTRTILGSFSFAYDNLYLKISRLEKFPPRTYTVPLATLWVAFVKCLCFSFVQKQLR